MLVGDKSLSEIYKNEREVSWDEGKQMADSIGAPFFEVSAKTGENVEEVFVHVSHTCL